MLPPRSKRYAGADAPIPRLRLIHPAQLGIAVVLLAILFALIFPRRSLLEALHRQEHFDDLTLAYIDNLKRVNTGDDDLTLLLTRARLDRMSHAEVEAALQPILEGRDERLRVLAQRTLAAASLREMGRLLGDYHGEAPVFAQLQDYHERIRAWGDLDSRAKADSLWIETLLRTPAERLRTDAALRAQIAAQVDERAQAQQAISDRLTLASLAMHAGLETEANHLLSSVGNDVLRAELPLAAEKALGQGHYETAGRLYLMAREHAVTVAEARERFRQGIGAFMAGGLHAAALQAAERHLGDLGDDIDTLRFLTRTALAAGDPRRAADYARRLVFLPAGRGAR